MTKETTQSFELFEPEILRLGQQLVPKIKGQAGTGFRLDGRTRELYRMLFYYFQGNQTELKKFGDLSTRKGIMLTGDVGCGKTVAMMIFEHIVPAKKKYRILTSRKIVREFMMSGPGCWSVIEKYSVLDRRKDDTYRPLCIDDLGQEDQDAQQFGNKVNVLEHILLERYDPFRFHGCITHVTTNIPTNKIEEFYGRRAADRFREMFNQIQVSGKSLRK